MGCCLATISIHIGKSINSLCLPIEKIAFLFTYFALDGSPFYPKNQMHRMSKYIIGLLLFLFISSCSDESGLPSIPDPKLDPVTQEDLSTVDKMVNDFLTKYEIPGASISVSKREKLVYEKGYGLANTSSQEKVTPDHLFRIASISKTYTAASIFKLIEDGKISLEDKIFGTSSLLGDNYGSKPLSSKVKKLTLNHLLHNTGGGWGVASGGDPIDYNPQMKADDFITYVLDQWPITNEPGSTFIYSNTGYWLLARIVEKISSKTYSNYIKDLTASAGITNLHVTTFTKSDRRANEVEYYGQNNTGQYIYTIAQRRDGDGGVVTTATDLLRFLCAIDGFNGRQDILNSTSLNEMKTPAATQENWGRGIGVWTAQSLLFSTGSLPGTRTWLMRGDNGISVVILLNSSAVHKSNFDNEFQQLLLNIVKDSTIPWKSGLDQF